ncbi:hypothetical protein KIPB_004545 [Kipferlia bialata]|uniref:Saposin B-type domain-containing protein n=1 Tax=Kipferlia bialata TaxID=797122 RepID=A0A9K3CX39_9EUKA|nr:hypothetical protein KIPB_004545 [Kipferlia bialata]|eukprot:g4545.t1
MSLAVLCLLVLLALVWCKDPNATKCEYCTAMASVIQEEHDDGVPYFLIQQELFKDCKTIDNRVQQDMCLNVAETVIMYIRDQGYAADEVCGVVYSCE